MQPSILFIRHIYKSFLWPPLTSSTHWPGAKPVSGQGPDPWTLAEDPGPMGWAHQSFNPSSQGYLLLWHNAIGHSHQNDGAQGILHADHSNGCRPLQPTPALALQNVRKWPFWYNATDAVFVCSASLPYCALGAAIWLSVGRVKNVLF